MALVIRVSKTTTEFHMISKTKNDQGQDMAITFKENQLKICPYSLKNDGHDMNERNSKEISSLASSTYFRFSFL